MREFNKILWGVVFILLGMIIGTNTLGFTNINIFFDGWWTLFLIIPASIGLISKQNKGSSFLLFLLGICLLFDARDIVSFATIFQLIFPFLLILIGFFLFFSQGMKKEFSHKMNEKKGDFGDKIMATFSEMKIDKDDEEFKEGDIEAVFGYIKLDLRKAKLGKSSSIRASATFGGITVLVPDDVKVVVKSCPIFGEVRNIVRGVKDYKKTIYIDATAIFGGVIIQ